MNKELIELVFDALHKCVKYKTGKHYIESTHSYWSLRKAVYECKKSSKFRDHDFRYGLEEDNRFFVQYKVKSTEVDLLPVGALPYITMAEIKKAINADHRGYNWLKSTGLDGDGWDKILELAPGTTTLIDAWHFYIEPSEACREMPKVKCRTYKYTTPVHSKKFVVVTRIK